ncbi:hypothetical protein ACIGB6_06495 [Paeniglutamicibacter gangotriensis]|uniref:hypothetical protein n=1 Tax=Paeniglutamicibacter gangotriensis TaxID=254787 RepID=UPI0037C97C3E
MATASTADESNIESRAADFGLLLFTGQDAWPDIAAPEQWDRAMQMVLDHRFVSRDLLPDDNRTGYVKFSSTVSVSTSTLEDINSYPDSTTLAPATSLKTSE